ncbi:hypothetical protein SISNIDRAFT_552148 [Sistotremastrum niveocremeum HHB9708]|uniref:BAG domain-containing protein n=1 Tax=Sistotremastrum niveocremeum HHB9708 TaxID=1314777 RepID=A0A164Q6D4_9AGAM|nr:hypothetical protein SISNIDRAFT_552148 [Sistotremastrum niveocremeum HHB9708]
MLSVAPQPFSYESPRERYARVMAQDRAARQAVSHPSIAQVTELFDSMGGSTISYQQDVFPTPNAPAYDYRGRQLRFVESDLQREARMRYLQKRHAADQGLFLKQAKEREDKAEADRRAAIDAQQEKVEKQRKRIEEARAKERELRLFYQQQQRQTQLSKQAKNSDSDKATGSQGATKVPEHTLEDQIVAATRIQAFYRHFLRRKRSISALTCIRGSFDTIASNFVSPPSISPNSSSAIKELSFTTATVLIEDYEQSLLRLLSRLDAVEPLDDVSVSVVRKYLFRKIAAALDDLDDLKDWIVVHHHPDATSTASPSL